MMRVHRSCGCLTSKRDNDMSANCLTHPCKGGIRKPVTVYNSNRGGRCSAHLFSGFQMRSLRVFSLVSLPPHGGLQLAEGEEGLVIAWCLPDRAVSSQQAVLGT